MTRPVFGLFANRADAEAARARLTSEVKVEGTRMLAKDTAAAVGDLKLDPRLVKHYRGALQGGDHLLVAKVAHGEDPKRIIRALSSTAPPEAPDLPPVEPVQGYSVQPEQGAEREAPAPAPAATPQRETAKEEAAPEPVGRETAVPPAPEPVRDEAPPAMPEQRRAEEPPVGEQLRVGEPAVLRGGNKGGSGPQPIPGGAGETAGRRLSYQEVESLGLLKDRTVEVVEMREEPVVEKEVVVREEVIVRKTTSERTETIRDTLRRTQVEVEELPAGDRR